MLLSIEEVKQKIESGANLYMAGDEELLKKLPRGNWIAGTIPYFMDENGGKSTRDAIYVTEVPDFATGVDIKTYSETELKNIAVNTPEAGYSIVIIPASSKVHVSYAQNAPSYTDMFMKPVVGWVAGVHLDDLGKIEPKVYNGQKREAYVNKVVVMHVSIPADKLVSIGIINLFKQGDGDVISFDQEGFQVKDCKINGELRNLSEYLVEKDIDIKLPLVANYSGTMVNVSFQANKTDEKVVDLYAPVFKGVEYKIAAPVADYEVGFTQAMSELNVNPIFSCNCILNYLYSDLEGKSTGKMVGPITFGEIAYQLLNQTLVYIEVK